MHTLGVMNHFHNSEKRPPYLSWGASDLGLLAALGPKAWTVYERLAVEALHGEGGRFEARISPDDIGHSIGLTRQTVSRYIKSLIGYGLVRSTEERHRYVLGDQTPLHLNCHGGD
jgi:DNA-binding MarR family transcriptional regulator